jgi:hypothetical protein
MPRNAFDTALLLVFVLVAVLSALWWIFTAAELFLRMTEALKAALP